jgi:hypothetical protein
MWSVILVWKESSSTNVFKSQQVIHMLNKIKSLGGQVNSSLWQNAFPHETSDKEIFLAK